MMAGGSDNLVSFVSQLLEQGLEEAGMHHRKEAVFTKELDEAFLGWLGLNRAFRSKKEVLEINPVVGVRHQPIEALLAALVEERFHPYAPPTISIHLGYLMPERRYMPWLFDREADNLPQIRELVARIVEYGFPFMESNSTLTELIGSMETGIGVPSELAYRLPLGYVLAQDNLRAQTYINDQLLRLGRAEDPYSNRYREFAAKLAEHIQSHDEVQNRSKRR